MKTNAKLYVMQAPDGRIKLGHSREPDQRLKAIGVSGLELIHETDVIEQAERTERLAHRVLALHGTHVRGEWFEATLEQALDAIEIAIRQAEQEELALGGRLNAYVRHEKKRVPFAIRMLPDVKAAGERAAKDENRSLSSLMETLLIEYLQEHGYLPKPKTRGKAK